MYAFVLIKYTCKCTDLPDFPEGNIEFPCNCSDFSEFTRYIDFSKLSAESAAKVISGEYLVGLKC